MKMTNTLRQGLAAMAVTAAVAAPTHALAEFMDFQVDETPYGGVVITADKMNGAYSERITFDGLGGFQVSAYGDWGQFLSNEGTVNVPSVINTGYALYSTFTSTGTVTDLGSGLFSFTGLTGSFDLFIDVNMDTTKALGATGADPVTLANTADDIHIAFAADLVPGMGGILVADLGGFFDLVFNDFTLTDPEGKAYFIDPSPFYLRVNVDGDFDNFLVAGTQTATGDVSAVFVVPEPGSLALLGLAMTGLGLVSRRKRA